MRAFDDLRGAIVTTDARDQLVVRFASVLGNENVTRPPKIARRLAQGSAGQQKFVPEWRLSIHQHDVEPMFEVQILQTVIEQERVHFPFVDRELPAFHPVFVD